MTPSFPPDDALGDLGVLVDEDAMVPQLAALARPGVVVEGCRPVYIRYRPDRTCLVQYDVTLRTPDRPTGQVRTAHVRVFTDDRARKRAGGEKLAALAALAAHGGAPPLPGVAFLPDVAGLLQVHPVDHDLPFLARAVDPAFMTRMFTAAGLHPASAGPAVPEPVRYKPGRKALLHYTPAVGPRLYAKVHPDDRAGRVAAQTAALIGAGITTPAVALARPTTTWWSMPSTRATLSSPCAARRPTGTRSRRRRPCCDASLPRRSPTRPATCSPTRRA